MNYKDLRALKVIIIVVLLTLFHFTSKAWFVVCEIPSELNDTICIAEGIIVGYSGNYYQKDILGEYGMLKVAITKYYYPSISVDTVFISQFSNCGVFQTCGIAIEELKKSYSLNQIITFIGNKSGIFGDSIKHIAIRDCDHIFLGSMEGRLRYDYENLRKTPLVDERMDYNLGLLEDDLLNPNEEWGSHELLAIMRVSQKFIMNLIVPEVFQIYLDLIAINQSKSDELRLYFLRRLTWSRYIDPNFFKKLPFTDKEIQELLKEHKLINEKWPSY